jgi:hypothetical protein
MAATRAAGSVVVELEREQEKKHSWRYKEAGEDTVLGTMYVQKRELAKMDPPNPQTLRVTIEAIA